MASEGTRRALGGRSDGDELGEVEEHVITVNDVVDVLRGPEHLHEMGIGVGIGKSIVGQSIGNDKMGIGIDIGVGIGVGGRVGAGIGA